MNCNYPDNIYVNELIHVINEMLLSKSFNINRRYDNDDSLLPTKRNGPHTSLVCLDCIGLNLEPYKNGETFNGKLTSILHREKFNSKNWNKSNDKLINASYLAKPFEMSRSNASEKDNATQKQWSRHEFIKRRKNETIRDEINLRSKSTVSRYFFKDLNDLKSKSIFLDEKLSLGMCSAPSSKMFKENFDVSERYKHETRKISPEIFEFINNKNDQFNRKFMTKKTSCLPFNINAKTDQRDFFKNKYYLYEPPLINIFKSKNYRNHLV